jgi:CheY-like chemotaxis protein
MDRTFCEVLIVDDDEDVCEALASFVTVDGYKSTTFRAGLEALQYVKDGAVPGLILVDAAMPDFDGWRFLEELGRMPCAGTVPAFLMSADTKLDEARARALGARGVLRKPFDLGKLSSVLEQHFGAP